MSNQKTKYGNGILSGEIRSLQALAKRVAEKGNDDNVSLTDLLKIVEFHGRASTRLATLLRAERDLDDAPSTNDLLEQAIQEVLAEMRAEDAPLVNVPRLTPAGRGSESATAGSSLKTTHTGCGAEPDPGLLNG